METERHPSHTTMRPALLAESGALSLSLEVQTKPHWQVTGAPRHTGSSSARMQIHEHSSAYRRFVESDPTNVAAHTTQLERWQTTFAKPRLSHWHSVCPAERDSVGDAPQELGCGSGMTCWRRLRDWQERGIWISSTSSCWIGWLASVRLTGRKPW